MMLKKIINGIKFYIYWLFRGLDKENYNVLNLISEMITKLNYQTYQRKQKIMKDSIQVIKEHFLITWNIINMQQEMINNQNALIKHLKET